MKAKKVKKVNHREKGLERLYGELAVASHNYENAVAHTGEGSNDNQEKWMKRSDFWLKQIETLSKTIETIEGNNQKGNLTKGEKISIGASVLLPIFGAVAQWLPYTDKGNALVSRLTDKAERLVDRSTKRPKP